jgi:dihydroneopterin aldolase
LLQIHLKNVQFFSYHGIFEEERILGNHFIVNITVNIAVDSMPVLHMNQSIDYVSVYNLVAKRMAIPTPLLETVITEIAQSILAQFSLALKVEIAIDKITPPIPSFEGKVGVSFTLERE